MEPEIEMNAREDLEEAHKSCPCRSSRHEGSADSECCTYFSGKDCPCCITSALNHNPEWAASRDRSEGCLWHGHASINHLADAAFAAGAEAMREKAVMACGWYEGGTAAQAEEEIRALPLPVRSKK